MKALIFFTVDVFTQTRFSGNPLAVVLDADTLDKPTMQAVAAEFNLSETTFVTAPADPANTAKVRIFNRSAEMAFAGHPMVGTAFVLAQQQPDLAIALFEVPAGIVRVEIHRDGDGAPVGASVTVPQPLSLGETIAPEIVARALQLDRSDVVTAHHLPIVASNGNPFVIAELTRDALSRCDPSLAAFREARDAYPQLGGRFALHVYCRVGQMLQARMFAPLSGTWEDPATGSANTPLAGLLLSLDPGAQDARFEIHQGVEMGRPSLLHVEARRTSEGIVASLRGSCVPVLRGEITI
ncbi:MAG: PhzF family phenazine biosynthesis protein [Sphingomonas sp.]|uniref:PhzF family phenazine biosynthesis protein n=1 Tax=Sphingomonas sp. TaxID=28214 RepID=UPI003F7CD7C3